MVVDATGQQSLLANALRIKRVDPHLRKAAIWSYYVGARRDEGDDGGATIVLHTHDKQAWFWFIPLSAGVTSIGLVGDQRDLLTPGSRPEDVYQAGMHQCPALLERLSAARRIGRIHVAREFSYSTERAAGDGWVLVGDAWGFIDPVYSSGVFLALKSGELAADCVVDALRAGEPSAERLGRWAPSFSAGAGQMRRLVAAFYTSHFSFGRFVQAFPEHQPLLTDLLIGKLFQPGVDRFFSDMQPFLDGSRT